MFPATPPEKVNFGLFRIPYNSLTLREYGGRMFEVYQVPMDEWGGLPISVHPALPAPIRYFITYQRAGQPPVVVGRLLAVNGSLRPKPFFKFYNPKTNEHLELAPEELVTVEIAYREVTPEPNAEEAVGWESVPAPICHPFGSATPPVDALRFSYWPNGRVNTRRPDTVSLYEFWQRLREPASEVYTKLAALAYAQAPGSPGEEAVESARAVLDEVTAGGVFKSRSSLGLVSLSGLWAVHFSQVAAIEPTVAALLAVPDDVALLYRSAFGGITVFFLVDTALHPALWRRRLTERVAHLGLLPDSDPNNGYCCPVHVAHDANAWLNPRFLSPSTSNSAPAQ